MFKKMFKDGYLNIEKLLFENYSKLNLTEKELIVLVQMLNLAQAKKNINIKAIKVKTGLSSSDVCATIDSLVLKGFSTIDVIIKNDKQESIIDVSVGLDKIYDFLVEEKRTSDLEENEGLIKKIVKLCEEELERTLSSNDLYIITHWVEDNIPYETIKWAIFDAVKSDHKSLNYIDKIVVNEKRTGNN